MAKFLAGVGFGQASGSVAGSTYSHNRFGPYIRNRAVPVNPGTTFQSSVRARLGNISQSWRSLTAAQRAEWIAQASQVSLVDALGQQYSPTGQQFYVGLNSVRIACSLATVTTPPALGTQAVITSLSVVSTGATGVSTVTFGPAIAVGAFYELQATAPISAGRSYVGRSEFKTLGYLTSADVSPYVATAAYAARFGGIAAGDTGKKIFWRLVPITSAGWRGVPFTASTIIA